MDVTGQYGVHHASQCADYQLDDPTALGQCPQAPFEERVTDGEQQEDGGFFVV